MIDYVIKLIEDLVQRPNLHTLHKLVFVVGGPITLATSISISIWKFFKTKKSD